MNVRAKTGLAGAVILAISAGLLKFSVLQVLDDAAAGAEKLSYSDKLLVLLPMFFISGLFAVGSAIWAPGYLEEAQAHRGRPFSERPTGQKVLIGALVLLFIAAGFGFRAWFLGRLGELGYVAQ